MKNEGRKRIGQEQADAKSYYMFGESILSCLLSEHKREKKRVKRRASKLSEIVCDTAAKSHGAIVSERRL